MLLHMTYGKPYGQPLAQPLSSAFRNGRQRCHLDTRQTQVKLRRLRAVSNGKAAVRMVYLLRSWRLDSTGRRRLCHFHSIVAAVWTSAGMPQEWKDVTIKFCTRWMGSSLETARAIHSWRVLIEVSSKS